MLKLLSVFSFILFTISGSIIGMLYKDKASFHYFLDRRVAEELESIRAEEKVDKASSCLHHRSNIHKSNSIAKLCAIVLLLYFAILKVPIYKKRVLLNNPKI